MNKDVPSGDSDRDFLLKVCNPKPGFEIFYPKIIFTSRSVLLLKADRTNKF